MKEVSLGHIYSSKYPEELRSDSVENLLLISKDQWLVKLSYIW